MSQMSACSEPMTQAPPPCAAVAHPFVSPREAARRVERGGGRPANSEERIEHRSHGSSVAQLAPKGGLRLRGRAWHWHRGKLAIWGGSCAC